MNPQGGNACGLRAVVEDQCTFLESFVQRKNIKFLTCDNQDDDSSNDSRHSSETADDGKLRSIIHLTLVADEHLTVHPVTDNQSHNSGSDENEYKQVCDDDGDHIEDHPGEEEETLVLVAAMEQHDVAQGRNGIGNKGCNAKILAIFSVGIAVIEIKLSNLRMVSQHFQAWGSSAIKNEGNFPTYFNTSQIILFFIFLR